MACALVIEAGSCNFELVRVSMAALVTPRKKRKRVVLTIEQKLEVLKLVDSSTSVTVICEKFGIGRSTVSNIKTNRAKLLSFKRELKEMGTKRDVKVTKLGEYPLLEKALYLWFQQKKMEGNPVSGPLLCEKAVELHKILHKDSKDSDFVASEGWKWRFCQRHGIRQLSLQGDRPLKSHNLGVRHTILLPISRSHDSPPISHANSQ